MLEEQVLNVVKNFQACYISDIQRELKITQHLASSVVKILEEKGQLTVQDKGIAKLVLVRSGEKYEK